MADDILTPSPEPTPLAMDYKRRRLRRYLAIGAFAYLALQGLAITAMFLFSSHRAEIAAVFQGTSPLLIATNGMFVSIVLGYMGVSLTERITLPTPIISTSSTTTTK